MCALKPFSTEAETWGLQVWPPSCRASTRGATATPCTSLAHSGWRYSITIWAMTPFLPPRSSLFVRTSQWPTGFFFLKSLIRSLPGRRHSCEGYQWLFSSYQSYLCIRSEMVGKMVNGTGLSDDRRVSEQVWLESPKSIKLKPNPLLNLLQKAWLNETDSLVLGRLTERIGMFLNLNVTSRYHMI